MKRLALTVALAAIAATGFAQQQQVSEGQVLYEQKKYEEAVKVLEKQVQKEPENGEALTYLGLARVKSGDAEGALVPLTKAVGRNDKDPEAHFGLGLAYLKLKKVDLAVSELERTVELAPEHAYGHYYLGMAYHERGSKALAIESLRRFVRLAPDAPEAPAVRSLLAALS